MRSFTSAFRFPKFLIVSVCVFFFTACKQDEGDKALFDSLEQTLTRATAQSQHRLEISMAALEEKMNAACSREKARIWLPRAQQVELYTQETVDYLSGLITAAKNDPLNTKNLFDSSFVRLKRYRDNILVVDEQITHEFTRSFEGLEGNANPQSSLSQHLALLQQADQRQLVVVLSQLRYSVMQAGEQIVAFCLEHVGCYVDGFEVYSAIIAQDATVLLPGKQLEVLAGIGAFTKSANPWIIVDGRKYTIDHDGIAKVKIAGGTKPGKYQKTVAIEFINQDGKEQRIERVVEWEVIER